MGLLNVIDGIKQAIFNNADFIQWVSDNFSERTPTMLVGQDLGQALSVEEDQNNPLITVAGLDIKEESSSNIGYKILLGFSVSNDKLTPSTLNNIDTIFTYDGFLLSEELRIRVENILKKAPALQPMKIESSTRPNEVFPVFSSETTFWFYEPGESEF